LVLLSAIVFSAKAVIAKVAYRYGVDPIALLVLRMGSALPVFVVAAVVSERRAKTRLTPSDLAKIVLLGVLGYYLASFLDFRGLLYISAGLERLILYVYPTLVVLISALVFRTRVRRSQALALVLTYAGIALAFHADFKHFGANVPLGAAL